MNKLVSIVVPIYNVEKYLANCLESILNQTYKNIEVILCDDGSPDNCGRICDEYAQRDTRIKVIHKENGGLSDARNAGIEIATGEYITLVDSDDFLMLDMIENLVGVVTDTGADIVSCQNVRCKENESLADIHDTKIKRKVASYENSEKMKAFLIKQDIGTVAWGKLYKTALFENICYPKGKYHEDVFTTYKLIHLAQKVATTNYVGYVYRINYNSITTEKFSVKKLDAIEGKLQQAEFIKKHYPNLSSYAYIGIIYACNQCLFQMAKSNYENSDIMLNMQKLFRDYGYYYLKSHASFKGKIFCLLSMINIRIVFDVIRN